MQQTAYRNSNPMFATIPPNVEQVDIPPNMIPTSRRNSTSSLLSTQSSSASVMNSPSVRSLNTDSLLSIDNRFVRKSRPNSRMSTGSLNFSQQPHHTSQPQQQYHRQYQQQQPQPQYNNHYQQQQQQQQYYPNNGQYQYQANGYFQQIGGPSSSNSVPNNASGSRHPSLSSTSSGLYYFPNGEVFRPRQQPKSRPSRPQRVPRGHPSSINQQQYPQLPPPSPQRHQGPPSPSVSVSSLSMPMMTQPNIDPFPPQPQPQPQHQFQQQQYPQQQRQIQQQRPPPSHGSYSSQYLNAHNSMPNLRNPNYYQQRPNSQYQKFSNGRPQIPHQTSYQQGPPSPAGYHNPSFPSPRQSRRPSLTESQNGSVQVGANPHQSRKPCLAENTTVPSATTNRISMSSQTSSVNKPASSSSSTLHNSSSPSPSLDVNNPDTPASSLTCIEPIIPSQSGAFAPKPISGDTLYSLDSSNNELINQEQQSPNGTLNGSGSDIIKLTDSSLCMIEENTIIEEPFEDPGIAAVRGSTTVPVSRDPIVKETPGITNNVKETKSKFYLSSEKSSHSSLFELDNSKSHIQPLSNAINHINNNLLNSESKNINISGPISTVSDLHLNTELVSGTKPLATMGYNTTTATTTTTKPNLNSNDATGSHFSSPIKKTNHSNDLMSTASKASRRDSVSKSHDTGFLATLERKISQTSVISSAIKRDSHKIEHKSVSAPTEKKASGFKGAFRRLFKSSSAPSNIGTQSSNSSSVSNSTTTNGRSPINRPVLNKSASVSSRFNKFNLKTKGVSSSTESVHESKNQTQEPSPIDLSDVLEENDDALSFEIGDESKKDKKTTHSSKKHSSGKKHKHSQKTFLDKDGDEFILDDNLAYLTSLIGLSEADFLSTEKKPKKSTEFISALSEQANEAETKSDVQQPSAQPQAVVTKNFIDTKRSMSRKNTIEKKRSISRNNTVSSCNTANTTTTSNTDSQSVVTRGSRGSAYSFEVEEGEYDLTYYYKHYKECHFSDQLDADQLQIVTHKRPKKPITAKNPKTPSTSCLKAICLNYDQSNFIHGSSTSLSNSQSHSSSSDMSSISRGVSPSSTKSTSVSLSKSSNPKTVNFSNTIYLNDTYSQDAYNRFNMTLKQSYSYLHANPNKVRDIRIELNAYKQYDMAVHELSRKNTQFFHN